MGRKIEIAIETIIHATEDADRILESFGILGLEPDDFELQSTAGHFDNPITLVSARVTGEQARHLLKRIMQNIPEEQAAMLIQQIEERTADSRLHLRLGKQEMVSGNLVLSERDPVKVRVHTPIYNKRETVSIFAGILRGQLD